MDAMIKRKIITIIIGILLLGVVVGAGVSNIFDLPKKEETFNSNLDSTTKSWVSSNLVNIKWDGNLLVSNNNNTFKMNFCYTEDFGNEHTYCSNIMLIRDYESESKYCLVQNNSCDMWCLEFDEGNCVKTTPEHKKGSECAWYKHECTTWANTPLKDMLEQRYVEKADEVLARVYRNHNKETPISVDVGNKTITTNAGASP